MTGWQFPGPGGGERWDERADGPQIRTLRADALGEEDATDVAGAAGTLATAM